MTALFQKAQSETLDHDTAFLGLRRCLADFRLYSRRPGGHRYSDPTSLSRLSEYFFILYRRVSRVTANNREALL